MKWNQKHVMCAWVIAGLLLTAPTFAQAANCPAPAETAGGPSNAHTRDVEANLRPAVIKPGDKPIRLVERMRQLTSPDSASR